MIKNKVKIFKIILGILTIILILGIIIYFFPIMKNLYTIDGKLDFKNKVQNTKFIGFLMLFGLQFCQIFLIVIPGEPIEILAGMCYGSFWGTIFVILSSSIISLIIFIFVKKYGRKFIYNFCKEKDIKKIEESNFFNNIKQIEIMLFILFLIPGTPKDLLTYISGLLPISTFKFIIISTIARIPSIITSTFAGDKIIIGDWKIAFILYFSIVLIALLFGLLLYFSQKAKNK